MPLTEAQIQRYSRQILLPDIGGIGQERLLSATVGVEVNGPGALIALAYLAGAGVGTLVLHGGVDDMVTATDIRHGFLLGRKHLGRPRFTAIGEQIGQQNPDVHVCRARAGSQADIIIPASARGVDALHAASLHVHEFIMTLGARQI